jgi:hypothetical protein
MKIHADTVMNVNFTGDEERNLASGYNVSLYLL